MAGRVHRLAVLGLGAAGAGIIPIGARFLIRPEAASAGYGLDTAPRDPYLAVKGIRDVATGLMLLTVLAGDDRRIAGGAGLAAAAIPLGDMILVLRRGGSRGVAFGVHGSTFAVMAAAATTLLSRTGSADRP